MIDLYKDKEIPLVGNTINSLFVQGKTYVGGVPIPPKSSMKYQVEKVLSGINREQINSRSEELRYCFCSVFRVFADKLVPLTTKAIRNATAL